MTSHAVRFTQNMRGSRNFRSCHVRQTNGRACRRHVPGIQTRALRSARLQENIPSPLWIYKWAPGYITMNISFVFGALQLRLHSPSKHTSSGCFVWEHLNSQKDVAEGWKIKEWKRVSLGGKYQPTLTPRTTQAPWCGECWAETEYQNQDTGCLIWERLVLKPPCSWSLQTIKALVLDELRVTFYNTLAMKGIGRKDWWIFSNSPERITRSSGLKSDWRQRDTFLVGWAVKRSILN